MKQTAVEWLYNQIENNAKCIYEVINQAKEMEKEQIMKARQDIFHTGNLTNEQYYNETFKSE
jgi:hypothetical protein